MKPVNSVFRILYAAGPGNVIGTYKYWLKGEDDPSQVSLTYSGQFYTVCRELDAQGYVISSDNNKELFHDDRFTIEHRPNSLNQASGIVYNLGYLWYGVRLILSAVRFQADVAVIADGTTHWFILSLLPWLGIQVVPSLHCVLWPKYVPPSKKEQIILNLSRNFFAKKCLAILSVSEDINKNLEQITQQKNLAITNFLPVYRENEFQEIKEPDLNISPFRVLFAGRIEENKGVFDLLEIAKRFLAENQQNIKFDICGDGSALKELKNAAIELGIDSFFICHGYCNKPKMREMFNLSHVVIVPTRTNFVEGFNKVVVEAVLAGRPVVTSSVCPALSYVRAAVIEVTPDDVKAYGDAILKLHDERSFYEEKQKSCLELQKNFFDMSQSWSAKLKLILQEFQHRKEKILSK